MRRTNVMPIRRLVRRLAPIACVAMLGVAAAACGSDDKSPSNDTSTVTTTPSGQTTSPATTAPATTAPKSGGAGF